MQTKLVSIVTSCLVLTACTVAVYWPVLGCGFVSFDDPVYVYQNRSVLRGLSWSGWNYAWTTWDGTNWHPLTWLSLEIDASLGSENPRGYHATNLVLHAMNSLLTFVVLFVVTQCLLRSVCVAAFFSLHPLHVESVAWISERKDVLSTFFLLLTVLAYVRYAARPSVRRYLPVPLLLALGLLAKSMLVTAPILFLLFDYWPLKRMDWNRNAGSDSRFPFCSTRTLLLEKVPLLILAFGDGLMTIFAQGSAVQGTDHIPLDIRIANLFNAYLWYLQKTFIPTKLIVFYPHPERNLSWLQIAGSVFVFVLISTWVLKHRRRRPHLLVGWAWFVVSLLPVIGLLQVGGQAYADRYAYIPHIGLFALIVWEVSRWVEGKKIGSVMAGLIAVAALIACGALTRTQIGYWKSSETLWTRVLEVIPQHSIAHFHLAMIKQEEGNHEQAIAHFERSLEMKSDRSVANALYHWGRSLIALNRPGEAEQKFLAALKKNRNQEGSLDQLVLLLQKQGRHAEAAQFQSRRGALITEKAQRNPGDAEAQFRLGRLMLQQGDVGEAVIHFERAVQLAPQSVAAHQNLGGALMLLKRNDEAKASFIRALELKPDLAAAHGGLAEVLESQNDISGAKKHFAEALRLNPSDIRATQGLARLLKR